MGLLLIAELKLDLNFLESSLRLSISFSTSLSLNRVWPETLADKKKTRAKARLIAKTRIPLHTRMCIIDCLLIFLQQQGSSHQKGVNLLFLPVLFRITVPYARIGHGFDRHCCLHRGSSERQCSWCR